MKAKHILALVAAILVVLLLGYLLLTSPQTVLPALNAFLMLAMPLALGIFLAQRFGLSWGVFGAGAATFIASQVFHIPFNIYLLSPLISSLNLDPGPGSADLAIYGGLLGFSAGIFEETARYLVLRFWRKDVRTWRQSLMFGAGHGGIEAIIVGLLTFVGFLQLVAFKNFSPQALESIASGKQLEALQTTLQSFWSLAWYDHLWGGLERFSAILIHLSATVLVFQSLRRKNLLWYLAAVLWHALVDFFAVFGLPTWGIPLTEGALFAMGLLSLAIVLLLRDPRPLSQVEEPAENLEQSAPPFAIEPAHVKTITSEKLEESRYD